MGHPLRPATFDHIFSNRTSRGAAPLTPQACYVHGQEIQSTFFESPNHVQWQGRTPYGAGCRRVILKNASFAVFLSKKPFFRRAYPEKGSEAIVF